MSDSNGYGIIWDLDGTLVDTAELHFAAWSALAREIGQPFSRTDFEATFGKRNPEIIRQLYGEGFSPEEIAELGHRKEELYRAAARQQGVKLLPGVKSLLQELAAAGYQQAIGSSAPRENLDLILRLTQIEQFFSVQVSAEDTQRGKPDPQVFLIAAERLRIPPARCLVMEDAPAGVQAAKIGGMKCIGVTFVGHHPEATLKQAGADLVVKSWEQVSVAVIARILK
jgi:beta-phosphoglucomutase